ncbi:MAG: sugar phosphate isomerase/epimerase [Planctomycetes bacterium]|nr:sugar phosphate isomerase/epimerase [Planctomycetota bacterium]
MKISFTTLACPAWGLDEIVRRAVEYGYDGIDFRGMAGKMAIYELPEFSTGLEQTAGKIRSAGLAVSGLSSGAKLYDKNPAALDASVGEVARYAKLCEALGCRIIRVFGGKFEGMAKSGCIGTAVATLRRMSQAAKKITIAVETHDDWINCELLVELLDQAKVPNAGILWDVHHPYRFLGQPPRQTWDIIRKRVCYTHIKDGRSLGEGKYEYTLPGEGDVPLMEIASLLKSGGYKGWLTLEWEKAWIPQLPEPQIALPAYAAYLRQLAG